MSKSTTRHSVMKVLGTLIIAAMFSTVVAIGAQVDSASAQAGGGTLAWGSNEFGQLGDDTTTDSLTPQATSAPALADMAGGRHHVVGLTDAGEVVVWGWNRWGQMGDGTKVDRPTPQTVSGLTATDVTTGHYHSMALDTSGQVWGWGRNRLGQLGDGTTTDRLSPIQVPGATNVAEIDAGREHSVALLNNGTLLSWGTNTNGQLGLGDLAIRLNPTAVPGLNNVDQIAMGRVHSIALLDNGTVMTWGDNRWGQIGDGTTTDRTTPTAVPGLTNIVDIAAFGFHTMALDSSGDVWVWGLGSEGQIGNGTTKSINTSPIKITSLSNIEVIGAGRNHSLAADDSGVLYAWGRNDLGQLGDGTTIERDTPVVVGSHADTFELVAGRDYSVALSSTVSPAGGGPDTTAPNGIIDEPGNNDTVGSPVSFSGTATDNVAIGTVRITVKRLSDGLWLRSNGSFGGFQRITTNLTNPGGTATDWSYSAALPNGSYKMWLPTTDAAGNPDGSTDSHVFDVSSGAVDNTPPNSSIDTPSSNNVNSPVNFSGDATDNVGVASVSITVKRLSDGLWLRSDGSFGGFQRIATNLTNPDGTATDWSLTVAIPPGDYKMFAPTFDTSGNKDPSTAQREFTVN